MSFQDEEDWKTDPECLDPEYGGVRPEGDRLTVEMLPPLAEPQKKRFWTWKWVADRESAGMNVNQARVYMEEQITRMRTILKRGRVHEAKDCYFVFPMDRHKE